MLLQGRRTASGCSSHGSSGDVVVFRDKKEANEMAGELWKGLLSHID